MADEWTSSAISEKMYREMNEYDDRQEPFSEQKKYYIDALQYANRRVIAENTSKFKDVFHVYMLTFSPELRDHIRRLDEDALNEVIDEAVKRIIKSRKPDIYRDYLQFEPLRWDLINGDGNGKGDGSLIAEHVATADTHTESEEDLTIIQRLAKRLMNENYFKTMRDNKEIYWYDGKGLYVAGQEWRIEEFCQINVPKIKTYEIQEVVNRIKRLTFVDRSEFDKDPYIRNTTNGLLDLKTLELKLHTHEYLSLTQLPEEYNPEVKCPNIDKFLSDVLRSEDIKYILQLIGYCLLNDCRYQVSVMLYGSDGANGKGTLLDLITTFLCVDNCSHRSLQSIDNNRFAVADLFGKMANTYADLKSTKLSETGNYKMLVTGDWITGEFKNKNSFKFRNKAKLWFSANEIPESDDKTDAFYRRWLIFHFDKRFIAGRENVNLINELTTSEELSGLLNLALKGLSELMDEGGFHYKTIEEIRKDYEIHTNDVNAFLSEECVVDITNIDYRTLATDAYAAYVNFCVARQTRPLDMNPFGKKLADKGIYNMRHKVGGQSEHYYDGIILIRSMRDRDQTTI